MRTDEMTNLIPEISDEMRQKCIDKVFQKGYKSCLESVVCGRLEGNAHINIVAYQEYNDLVNQVKFLKKLVIEAFKEGNQRGKVDPHWIAEAMWDISNVKKQLDKI